MSQSVQLHTLLRSHKHTPTYGQWNKVYSFEGKQSRTDSGRASGRDPSAGTSCVCVCCYESLHKISILTHFFCFWGQKSYFLEAAFYAWRQKNVIWWEQSSQLLRGRLTLGIRKRTTNPAVLPHSFHITSCTYVCLYARTCMHPISSLAGGPIWTKHMFTCLDWHLS